MYKIRNKNMQYAIKGRKGSFRMWSKYGSTWNTLQALSCHLTQASPERVAKYIEEGCTIIEYIDDEIPVTHNFQEFYDGVMKRKEAATLRKQEAEKRKQHREDVELYNKLKQKLGE